MQVLEAMKAESEKTSSHDVNFGVTQRAELCKVRSSEFKSCWWFLKNGWALA